MSNRKSQKQMIREYLEDGNVITPEDARIRFGCNRLSGRIKEIREDLEWENIIDQMAIKYIDTEMIPVIGFGGQTKRVAQYSMIEL